MVEQREAEASSTGTPDRSAGMVSADLPGTGGRIRERQEDFEVEEIPAYLPGGEGEHLMVLVRKRGLTTDDAARILAQRAGLKSSAVGFAGRKDRHAVTTQWLSIHGADEERFAAFEAEGLEVLRVGRHKNKLKTGHLHGNRFRVVVRGVVDDAEARAKAILERIGAQGLPNGFGPQRFGRDGRNPERALSWIMGRSKPPRDRRKRKMLVSALQADLFNALLRHRLSAGLFAKPLVGDVMKRHDSGGMFVAEDADEAAERMERGEVSPTGPIYGARMWWPEAEALALEEAILAEGGLDREILARFRADGRGSRRTLRIFPGELDVSQQDDALTLVFTLDPGAFATTLVAEVTKADVAGAPSPVAP